MERVVGGKFFHTSTPLPLLVRVGSCTSTGTDISELPHPLDPPATTKTDDDDGGEVAVSVCLLLLLAVTTFTAA